MKRILLICISCIFIDQILKLLVVNNLILNSSLNIINNIFSLTYVHNYGAAFSILSGNRFLLIFITIFAMLIIYYLLIKKDKRTLVNDLLYGVLLGGIIGNLIDRIINGYVIDYLDFKIFSYNFPIFNFADVCIVVSMIIIFILSFRGEKDGKDNS